MTFPRVAPARSGEKPGPEGVFGSTAPGERIYAIGDVHGRIDLLAALLGRIRTDNAFRPSARTTIVLLGDLVDRGPDSAEVVVQVAKYAQASDRFVVLKGNHEALMVGALRGDIGAAAIWLRVGGDAALRSWGVSEDLIASAQLHRIVEQARRRVPAPVLAWMARLPLLHQTGGLLFVHAGVRPGVPLEEQAEDDLLWITDDFLESDAVHPYLVVHGHSARDGGPELRGARIGLDTGAYRTGRLTALGLEGGEHWLIDTGPAGAAIPPWSSTRMTADVASILAVDPRSFARDRRRVRGLEVLPIAAAAAALVATLAFLGLQHPRPARAPTVPPDSYAMFAAPPSGPEPADRALQIAPPVPAPPPPEAEAPPRPGPPVRVARRPAPRRTDYASVRTAEADRAAPERGTTADGAALALNTLRPPEPAPAATTDLAPRDDAGARQDLQLGAGPALRLERQTRQEAVDELRLLRQK